MYDAEFCGECVTGDLPPEPPVGLESEPLTSDLPPESPVGLASDLQPTAGAETMVKGTKGPKRKRPQKKNYFWCPILDCASGPVQKVGQHLTKVHRVSPQEVARLLKKKTRAPLEAVKLKLPNPSQRSTKLCCSRVSQTVPPNQPNHLHPLHSTPMGPSSMTSTHTCRHMQVGTGVPPQPSN